MISIENEFSEDLYLKGESLLDMGAVVDTHASGKNQWNVYVKDGNLHEVEIKGLHSKNRKTTCDCVVYKKDKTCSHIVAALLHLRKTQSDSPAKPRKAQRFTINTILNNVDHDDLKRFTKFVASKDRSYNFMLKTVFASSIDMEDNAQKYKSLLQPLIKPISTSKASSSTADIRLALRIIQELDDQMSDELSLGRYQVVADIISGTLPSMHYLYRNYISSQKVLKPVMLHYNKTILDVYGSESAPKLLDAFDQICVEFVLLSYYNFVDQENELVKTLYANHRSTAITQLKAELPSKSIARLDYEERLLYMSLCALLDIEMDPKKNTVENLIAIVDQLSKWNEPSKALHILKLGVQAYPNNKPLQYALVDHHFTTEALLQANELGIKLFVKYKDFKVLDRLIDHNENKSKLSEQIENELKSTHPKPDFLARYYQAMQHDDALLDVLETAADLRLLMEYDRQLYKKHYKRLEEIYLKSVDTYLTGYAGRSATYFLEEVFAHLRSIGANKLDIAIKRYLDQHYAHRGIISDWK